MESREYAGTLTFDQTRQEAIFSRSSKKGAERRTEGRFPTNDPARMRVLQPLANKAEEVRILDVSRGGFKLAVPQLLQPGAVIQIHIKSAIILAEVRYCAEVDGEFHAGVRFQDVFWTHDQTA